MAKYTPVEDKDFGLKKIFEEMGKLKSMCVKVGVTEDVGSKKGVKRVRATGKNGKKLKRKVKVENSAGPTLAEIASRNELGVLGPPFSQYGGGKWFIPPRPFVRGWADGKRELIAKTEEMITKKVSGGKWSADDAIKRLGEFGQSGIKSYIRNGELTQNADSTVARKTKGKGGKTTPLIDTGTLRNSIRYQVIEKPMDQVSEK